MRIDIVHQFIGGLYTDSVFLELFKNCRDVAFGFVGLEEEECDFFKNVDIERIKKINNIIREKRLSVLKNCFSYFSEFYPDTFSSLTSEFLMIPGNYSGNRSGRLEMCQDFYSFASQKMDGFRKNNFPKYLKEIILFDYLSKSCADIRIPSFLKYYTDLRHIKPSARPIFNNHVIMQHFRWPIMDVINSLKQNEIPKNVQKGDCTIIFAPHKNKFKILQLSDTTRLLIDFLNGEYRASELHKMFGKENQKKIDASLEFLSTNNLLLYR